MSSTEVFNLKIVTLDPFVVILMQSVFVCFIHRRWG